MDGNEILQNLRAALERLLRLRLVVSSPNEKAADVPMLYAVLLALACPVVAVLTFLLGWARKYTLRIETRLARRE